MSEFNLIRLCNFAERNEFFDTFHFGRFLIKFLHIVQPQKMLELSTSQAHSDEIMQSY